MIGRRVVLAASAGLASVGGLQLSGFLALAALDGGQELPGWLFYSVPILATVFLPILPMLLGLFPKGRWRGITVGMGGAVGAAVALLAVANQDGSAAWLLGVPAIGAFVGTFAWVPGAADVEAGSAQLERERAREYRMRGRRTRG